MKNDVTSFDAVLVVLNGSETRYLMNILLTLFREAVAFDREISFWGYTVVTKGYILVAVITVNTGSHDQCIELHCYVK